MKQETKEMILSIIIGITVLVTVIAVGYVILGQFRFETLEYCKYNSTCALNTSLGLQ